LEVLNALTVAEKRAKPHWEELFNDVYKDIPPHLVKQKQEAEEHMAKYPEHYHSDKH
jgi:TPP-dependent pyruvate/acetoin dehydrogenase alpha subunit